MKKAANTSSFAKQQRSVDRISITLLPGLSAELYAAGRDRFEVLPSLDHLLLVQVGIPAQVACRIGSQYRNSIQSHGDIALVPVGMSSTWEVDPASIAIRFRFTIARLRSIATDMGYDDGGIDLAPQMQERDPQIEHIAAAINDAMTAEEPIGRVYAESLGMALLTRIVIRFGEVSVPEVTQGLTKWQLHRVFDYIDSNLESDLPLVELAGVVGLGVSHFRNQFRLSTATTVHRYVMQRRVERASALLLQGRSISEAALEAGFTDPSHMARLMRQKLGILPREVVRRGNQGPPILI
ncbi:MAG TPA: AraC family transcriptional regulator [Aliidongia sp.]|uniref:AraC family transcriptional regulator n=1 Tax=Aliidongia sp. TaxID=1914230 RepID=UPI002DDCD0AB|nr:AraC family transcriptional regulator [Aliidongia sp.]HEV2678614.1 AraC family transcriptional regulator [Aliidongia sp.]